MKLQALYKQLWIVKTSLFYSKTEYVSVFAKYALANQRAETVLSANQIQSNLAHETFSRSCHPP